MNKTVTSVEFIDSAVTHPKVRSGKAVGGRDIVGCLGGVGVVGIDVSQQGTHHCRHTWAHVLRWQAGEVAANEGQACKQTLDTSSLHRAWCMKTTNIECKPPGLLKNISSNIRHRLVDGLHSVTHGKLIYNLLGGLLKVNLPCIIPFSIRDLYHTIVLDVRHIMEEVLQWGDMKELWKELKEMGWAFDMSLSCNQSLHTFHCTKTKQISTSQSVYL